MRFKRKIRSVIENYCMTCAGFDPGCDNCFIVRIYKLAGGKHTGDFPDVEADD